MKKRIILLLLSAFAAAACGKEYIRDSPSAETAVDDGLIRLRPLMGRAALTKSVITGTDFPAGNDIVLSARCHCGEEAATAWFDTVRFSPNGEVWSSDKYWPLEGELSFMGYSAQGMEFDTAPVTSDDFSCWEMAVPGDYGSQQVDILFLCGDSTTGSYSAGSGPCDLCFRHAMARLVFEAASNAAWDEAGNKGVIIDDISVNNIYMEGLLRLYNTGEVSFEPRQDSQAIEHLSVTELADYQVTGEDDGTSREGILVPPQSGSSITVTYTVRDGNRSVQHSEDYEINEDWEANEMYVYKLAFDGESLLLELAPHYLTITSSVPNCLAISNPHYAYANAPYIEYSLDAENWKQVPWYTGTHGSSGMSGVGFGYDVWDVNLAKNISQGYLTGKEKYLIYFNSVIYLRGNNPGGLSVISTSGTSAYITQIWFKECYTDDPDKTISIDGDLKYLLCYDEPMDEIPDNLFCFAMLFGGNTGRFTNIVKLPDLRVKKINAVGCLYKTFLNTGVIQPPALTATTLSKRCYESAFQNCRHLSVTPELPALGSADNTAAYDACYRSMFANCPELTETGEIALRYYSGCDNMFKNCSSLVSITAYDCEAGGTDWVSGVPAYGEFTLLTDEKPSDALVASMRGDSHIPVGWQVKHRASGYIWAP